MKAIVRDAYGPPESLRLEDVPLPKVSGDDVLVRLRAASLNAADPDYLTGTPLLTRMGTGLRRPKVRGLGLDAAGTVEAVGPHVTRFRPGDEVLGDLTAFGYGPSDDAAGRGRRRRLRGAPPPRAACHRARLAHAVVRTVVRPPCFSA